jgi:hypothetical protein
LADVSRAAHGRSLAKLASVWLDWRTLASNSVNKNRRGRWTFR